MGSNGADHINWHQRLYAQLRPDDIGIAQLLAVQQDLSASRMRLVPEVQLHVTLVHYGKLTDIYRDITACAPLSKDAYEHHVQTFITELEDSMGGYDHLLLHDGYDLFGPQSSTLVALLRPTEQLRQIRADMYAALLRHLKACGVSVPVQFAKHNHNLQHAHTFRPHVTLAKGYLGDMPITELGELHCTPMPLVYE